VSTVLKLAKRQIVDDAVHFVAVAAGLSVLVLSVLVLAFLYSPRDVPPFERITYLFHIPFLLALGFCTLGITQSHGDRLAGRVAWLSTQPVSHGQIVLARMITGLLLLATAFAPLVLIACIYKGLMSVSVYSWRLLAELFLGAILMSLACYGLGLRVARSTNSVTRALALLPLALLLPVLLIVKGFGWPVCGIFLVVAVASSVGVIWPSVNKPVPVLASGVVAIVLAASLLFLGRYLCNLAWAGAMSEEARRVEISPSGIIPAAVEQDPNVTCQSTATGWIKGKLICSGATYDVMEGLKPAWHLLAPLGMVKYFRARNPRTRQRSYRAPSTYGRFSFDPARGLLVHRSYRNEQELYAGPEGMSETPDARIGRFAAPLIATGVLYDQQRQRFFALDFKRRTVLKGPVLEDPALHPVAIGDPRLDKPHGSNLRWTSPARPFRSIEKPRQFRAGRRYYTAYSDSRPISCDYLPVLDVSGRILLLDLETLTPGRCVGRLPRPLTVFGEGLQQPEDLLSYSVLAINSYRQHEYIMPVESLSFEFAGVVATSLSRDGMSLTMAVYDEEGQLTKTALTRMFATTPWGGIAMALRYTFESLHPPILTLASFFAANSLEAGATHRALFLMPNSFVALQRDRQTTLPAQLAWALLFMMPALLFAAFLAWRVAAHATQTGLPGKTRGLWVVATMAFGLPAYVTYRLTWPKTALVTCDECGLLRRPDRDECHHCGGGWTGPQSTAPAWRAKEKPEAGL